MLRSKNGSILVTTLIFFSIIITICISCIAQIYSDNNYSKLQYKNVQIKELALSGIEVTKSNILSQVEYAVKNIGEEVDFKNYFLGNTSEIIGNISKAGLDNVRVSLKSKASTDNEGNIVFKIESICKEGNYTKRVGASVKIINPWNNYVDTTDEDIDNVNIKKLVLIYDYEES